MLKNSVHHWLLHNEIVYKDQVYLRQPKEDSWLEYTWGTVIKQARSVAQFLYDIGLKPGDTVSIFSKNCAEWFIVDFGITLAGLINVPLYVNQRPLSIAKILQHAEVKLVFIGKLDNFHKTRSYIPKRLWRVNMGYHLDIECDFTFSDILAIPPLQHISIPSLQDIFTIVYTSGTTGRPLGAVYTYENIANYLALYEKDIRQLQEIKMYRLLSYLPLAHIYERAVIEIGSLVLPAEISFIKGLDTFIDNVREVQPVFFTAVPRIWSVFQQKIEQKFSRHILSILLRLPLLSRLIKRIIRNQLGLQQCVLCFSGASPLPESLGLFFQNVGITILEGYGQTENLAYAMLNQPSSYCFGYVGTPRVGVEIKIEEAGEILIKSPCIMQKYYKNETATEKAIDKEGWLHSGDLGEMDARGRIKVLGRKNETFKNQTGEFVLPVPIEKRLASNPFIDQLCLLGPNISANILLLTLHQTAKKSAPEEIKASLLKTMRDTNKHLASFEKVHHIIIVTETWTAENGLLTPTLKVKRANIAAHYKTIIQKALQKKEMIVWEQLLM